MSAGNFREVVPVIAIWIERNITVGEEQVEIAIIVQIAELRPETPASNFHSQIASQVFIFQIVSRSPFLWHPEIIPLNKHAVLRDVAHIDGIFAAIENIAERGIHAALGSEADSSLLTHFPEAPCFVEVQFRNAVVVRDKQIQMTGSSQIGSGCSERPAMAVDSSLLGIIFKLSVTEITQQILSPAILRVFEALRHDLCIFEMPEVDLLGVVTSNKEIQLAISVVVEPQSSIRVHPCRQTCRVGHATEAAAVIVMKEFRFAPLI